MALEIKQHTNGGSEALARTGRPRRPAVPGGAEGEGAEGDPGRALGALLDELAQLRELVDRAPFANPVQIQALNLLRRLQQRELEEGLVGRLIQRLTLHAFRQRAERLRNYLGEVDPAANAAVVAGLIRRQAMGGTGELLPFADFRARLERVVYGLVITAHPTFSLAVELQRDLVALALGRDVTGQPLDEARKAALLARVEDYPHRPEMPLDLDGEHAQATAAIEHIQDAIERLYGIALDVARELYPDEWRGLRPALVSVASWVGYDTDGRSDISWATTFAKRLATQKQQLRRYQRSVAELASRAAANERLVPLLELIDARISLAIKACEDELQVFNAWAPGDQGWPQRLARLSRGMVENRARRMSDSRQLVELIERVLAQTEDEALARDVCVLRAQVCTHGAALARTHVRINAIQLHNAIRKTIGMDHPPDDPSHRLSYLNAITRLVDEVRPVTVHFGSVAAEKATARRVFMIMVQMLKYLDASEPLRFLIAECETPFTLITALYFARLFGVEDRIDISPLFETRKALERGISIIEGTMEVPAWRDYLRRRGRICIQTGFSDAGRYMGQIAASMAIERIRLGLGRVLEEHGLTDIEVVIFDTHGESIGRGAHPDSLLDRFRYLDTPESRRRFRQLGIRVCEETSYQGGDGYLFFMTPESAFAVVTRALEHALEPPDEGDDPYYAQTDYVDEFLAAVRLYNDAVIEDPSYAAFLGAYGTNLLYPTGSRPVQRQYDTGGARVSLEHPSQIRAIPHNSILQQLGVLANTVGGVGEAVAKDPDGFHHLYHDSPRFRRLMRMVEHAFKFTDLAVVRCYIELFDPAYWLARAQAAKEGGEQEELTLVAAHLERGRLHERLMRIFRVFQRDYMELARALRTHRRLTRDAGETPIAVDAATRDNMHMLNALRLALIQRLMLRAVHVPDFSDRHSTTHEALVGRLLHLDVEPALALLAEIFPVTEGDLSELDYGEKASYRSVENQSYAHEHETIFKPIAQCYELIRRIGSGIIHQVGALG
jgi:phosphoenolpyruvate carboxylase